MTDEWQSGFLKSFYCYETANCLISCTHVCIKLTDR